jgi:hypothetical protein
MAAQTLGIYGGASCAILHRCAQLRALLVAHTDSGIGATVHPPEEDNVSFNYVPMARKLGRDKRCFNINSLQPSGPKRNFCNGRRSNGTRPDRYMSISILGRGLFVGN